MRLSHGYWYSFQCLHLFFLSLLLKNSTSTFKLIFLQDIPGDLLKFNKNSNSHLMCTMDWNAWHLGIRRLGIFAMTHKLETILESSRNMRKSVCCEWVVHYFIENQQIFYFSLKYSCAIFGGWKNKPPDSSPENVDFIQSL